MSAELTPDLPHRTPLRRPPRFPGSDSGPLPEEKEREIDWSDWYLTWEDDVGQSPEQTDVVDTFRSSVGILAGEQSWQQVRIGVDEFFAWMADQPLVRVSPDVFLLDDPPPPSLLPGMWETWKPGVNPPRFALEVVSDDWQKDYRDNPRKYDLLGTDELVLFDPEAARGATRSLQRVALEVHRREKGGSLREVYHGPGPVRSEELGVSLVVLHDEDGRAWLRLSRDTEGRELIPTNEEARALERAAREEAERRQAEERAAREELERKLAEALAALERVQPPPPARK